MAKTTRHKTHKLLNRPPFECIALLLQGGGALGAYQAGVYEALAEADLHPDWVAGISIGAINAAIIAGNPPKERAGKLRAFWEQITSHPTVGWTGDFGSLLARGEKARDLLNKSSAMSILFNGAPGFFTPRMPPPSLHPDGSVEATSYYDTRDLRGTLERLVDFDRINASETRFSVGAVNVTSGNFVYFDTETHHIRAEHVMASGALPPGFPAVEVDGEFYWDGGLVSNTPLQWVVHSEPRLDTLAFQVDLWNARGDFPRNLAEIETRRKEIQFSSRTRAGTDQFKQMQRMRSALATLLAKCPDDLKASEEAQLLNRAAGLKVYNIVHLIYRAQHYEGDSKDYEFSRLTMQEHWRAGYLDTVRTLRHPQVLERPDTRDGVRTFDLSTDGVE
jgi:NTE family protein